MVWTILNLICFAIGAYMSKALLKETKDGKWLILGNVAVALIIVLGKGFPFGITFLVTTIIAGFISAIFMEPSDPNGYHFGDEQKAWNAQQAAKARANPTLAMLDSINLSMKNNSPSVPFFGCQQDETDKFAQQRLETMGDIRAGRAPNGTNGVWL